MKFPVFLASAGLCLCLTALSDASAQTPATEPPVSPEETDSSEVDSSEVDSAENGESASLEAADLQISPRVGVGHSSSGGGFDGTTQFEGFLPLRQVPGQDITYFAPRFLLDNDGNVGGNLILGHRVYSTEGDRIWGGYLAFDNRETDDSDFSQLGIGFETLGEVWDVRVNGYLPLGDTSEVIDESSFDTGFQVNSGFEGNLLVLSNRREQQVRRIREVALGGFDAEVSARLLRWNDDDGDLRTLAGLYLYDGDNVDSTLGWRLGLEVRPVQNIVLGVSVQDDDLFGTNVIGSFMLTWPRVRPRGPVPEEIAVAARLGEPVRRSPSIAVDIQEELDVSIEETIMPLMNPEEEQPYRFIHVTLGRRGGDGTVENPFGTVAAAIDDAISDGNNIIYVDAGNNANIPAFTIPDLVRVLSQGPVQFLAGMPFPGFPRLPSRLPFSPVENFNNGILVELPFSGDGNFPTIRDNGATDLVTMGDRTVLSGFRIVDAPGNAVVANNVEDIEIRDNTILNPGERGVFLNDVVGNIILFDNTITGARGGADSGQGILIRNSNVGSVEAFIERQQLEDNRIGIEIIAAGDRNLRFDPQQVIDISETNILRSREQGLVITTGSLGTTQATFIDGLIANSGSDGVLARVTDVGSQELTLEDSIVQNNAGNGIRAVSGVEDGSSTAAQEVYLRRNQILSNAGDGISIESNEVAAQEFGITDNTIQNNGGAGIRAEANNVSFQEYVTDVDNESFGISGNTIANNGDVGISLDANDSSTVVADIQNNTLSGNVTNGAPDLTVSANTNSVDVCTVLNANVSATGIRLDNNSTSTIPALFEVGDLTTVSVRNGNSVTFTPNVARFTDRPGITSCFRN
jgi:hypothetical protein